MKYSAAYVVEIKLQASYFTDSLPLDVKSVDG